MSNRRDELVNLVVSANKAAFNKVSEHDYRKSAKLAAIYDETTEKVLDLFFPSDMVKVAEVEKAAEVVEAPKAEKPAKTTKKSKATKAE